MRLQEKVRFDSGGGVRTRNLALYFSVQFSIECADSRCEDYVLRGLLNDQVEARLRRTGQKGWLSNIGRAALAERRQEGKGQYSIVGERNRAERGTA